MLHLDWGVVVKKYWNVIFSVIFSLFIILGVVRFTIGFKELYYFDIGYLDIPSMIGLPEEEIKLNYDYVIDYNFSKEPSEFNMPTIKSSPEGQIHFEEVREIFRNVDKLFVVCMIVSIIGLVINIKEKHFEFLKTTSKLIITIPLVLSLPVIIDFNKSFIIFHKLLFDNDYWIFDPNKDPVIKMLPEEFFFHAGIMILVLILLASIISYGTYKLLKRKKA